MKQIFINLACENLDESMRFYEAIGFEVNPMFTDEQQKCMVWSEHIYVMLQSKDFFGNHLHLPEIEKNCSRSATFTLPVENLAEVHEMVEKGVKAGGAEVGKPLDVGFMFLRNIEDPDGNVWGIIHLDMDKFIQQKKELHV